MSVKLRMLRGRAAIGLAGAILAVAAVGGWWRWGRVQVPEIPNPQLPSGSDPAAAADVASARQAVENSPRSAAAWGEYGLTLRAYELHPEADVCFRTAAALDPSEGRWPYLLGHHLAPSDPAAAIDWFRKAVAGNVPDNARETVRLQLAETLFAADRADEARAVLDSCPHESARAKLLAARLAVASGDDRRALGFLADLTGHPIAARQALTLQSQVYLRQKRAALAAHVSSTVATAPDGKWPDPIADEVQRRDHSRVGRLDQAVRLLKEGRPLDAEMLLRPLSINTTDPRVFVGLADARLAQGDREGAIRTLEAGAKAAPRDVSVNYQLGLRRFEDGERLWAAGQMDAAQRAFRAALERFEVVLSIDPTFGKALLLKGVACQRFLGRTDEGLAILQQFVRMRPEVGEGHLLLGQALAALGKPAEARVELQRAVELSQSDDRRAADALSGLNESPSKPQ